MLPLSEECAREGVSWLSWYKRDWAVSGWALVKGGGERVTCMKDGERFVAK